MNTLINQLIAFGLKAHLIEAEDSIYASNLLLDLFHLDAFHPEDTREISCPDILDKMCDYACEQGLIEDTSTSRDLFDTRIMNCLMPRPSEVIKTFKTLYQVSPEKATDYYYALSIASNYIRKSRTDKNIKFSQFYKYGDIQISINLSKPEKDPKEIAKAKTMKSSGYPQCLLCKENVGFAGDLNLAARQTHRIIPLSLSSDAFYMQYSPYVYYNEHCIVFNDKHIPMKVDHATFLHLFDFIDQFPHYMLGSNADLPIVGGSILTHDHYQGGRHRFPIQDAKVLKNYQIAGYEDIHVEMVYWPLSTIRLTGDSKEKMIALCDHVLEAWIPYQDESLDIIAYTDGERHNTITPIARKSEGHYQMDLVLRNNRTNAQYPDGIFHPHKESHHIKKENIGLIEVMGLAILPPRLKKELKELKACLLGQKDIDSYPDLVKHKDWFEALKKESYDETTIDDFMEKALTKKFVTVLEDAGVFKMNEAGQAGFEKFIKTL